MGIGFDETPASAETEITVPADNELVVDAPPDATADGYFAYGIYVSTATVSGDMGENMLQHEYYYNQGPWTEPSTGLIVGHTPLDAPHAPTGGVGDGNISYGVSHVGDGAPDRITENFYDW